MNVVLLLFCSVLMFPKSSQSEIKFECETINKNNLKCSVFDMTNVKNLVSYINTNYNGEHHYHNRDNRNYIKILNFKRSLMTEIVPIVFIKLAALETFDASGVQLLVLKRENFNSAAAVKELNLSNNNLTTLGNMVFSLLESLQTLDLSNNAIESFHDGAFDDCSKNLRSVNLSFNKVKHIKMETFISLSTIKHIALFMDFNDIEELPKQPDVNNKLTFSAISFKNNKLSNFDCSSFNVSRLNLNNNQLEEAILNCTLTDVSIANNKLNKLTIGETVEVIVALNNSLVEITINDNVKIRKLDLSGNKDANIILKQIKDLKTLTYLDISDILLGPLSLNSFAKMSELEILKLKNTGISNIDYGTFAHQKKLKILDIGGNQLKEIDFHMFTPLKALEYFDISNNNVTKLDNAETIKSVFPALIQIDVSKNKWNCSYLAKLEITFHKEGIIVKIPSVVDINSTNIMGIECTKETHSKMELLPENGELINSKFNEMVQKMEASSANNDILKLDMDVIQSKLFKLQNDFFEVKTQLLQTQLTNLNSTSMAVGDINNNVRSIVEEINKTTLDKQNLAHDKVTQKLNELQLQLKAQQFEADKMASKYQIVYESFKDNNPQSISQRYNSEDKNNTHSLKFTFTEILLTLASGLIIIICILKLKQFYQNKHNKNTQISKACSQNTLNTVYDNSSV